MLSVFDFGHPLFGRTEFSITDLLFHGRERHWKVYPFGGDCGPLRLRSGGWQSQNDSTESNRSVDALVRALRLSFDRRTGAGYFLRAESFFNTISHMDNLDKEPAYAPPISAFYGGRSLHTRSPIFPAW